MLNGVPCCRQNVADAAHYVINNRIEIMGNLTRSVATYSMVML